MAHKVEVFHCEGCGAPRILPGEGKGEWVPLAHSCAAPVGTPAELPPTQPEAKAPKAE